jgi:multidrug resistance efflux pump
MFRAIAGGRRYHGQPAPLRKEPAAMADRRLSFGVRVVAAVACATAIAIVAEPHAAAQASPTRASASAQASPAAQASPGGLRLHGLVEAVEFFNLVTPTGANGQLTIVHILAKGTLVKKGAVIVEFDRQAPLREAIDKQAEWKQFEEDIRKKQAEMKLQDAVDDTSLKTAENDLALAKLETTKNDVLPRIEAEKNTLTLQAAEARLPSLRTSIALKRKAAAAELEILMVKRDRAARVRDRATATADALLVRSPIDGLVVPRTIWKNGGMGEPEEGDDVWPGYAMLDIVSPGAMRVKVKVNQVDVHRLKVGMPARVTLDAYPGRSYPGRLTQIAPIAARGQYSAKVRTFAAVFAIEAQNAEIAPDLSAAVDLLPEEDTRAAR